MDSAFLVSELRPLVVTQLGHDAYLKRLSELADLDADDSLATVTRNSLHLHRLASLNGRLSALERKICELEIRRER